MGDRRLDLQNMEKKEDQSASGFRKTGIIIILAFVVLLLATIIIDVVIFPTNQTGADSNAETAQTINTIWSVVFTLLLNIAAVGITIGGGTVLYGHFDFVQYVKNTLSKVILEYEFVDQLDDEGKEALMRKLQKHLVYHDKISGNDTLFDFVNTEVRGLTQGPYYEKMTANFSCRRESDVIVKHIIRQMDINLQQAPDYQFDLAKLTRCYFYGSVEEAKKNPPFKVIKLIINGDSYTERISLDIEKASDERGYGCITQYDFKPEVNISELISPDKVIRILMDYETRVPISDKTLGFRTYFPCKQLHTTFVYSSDFRVNADIFCFKDRKLDGGLDKERIQIVQNDSCISITFPDWLLPGDGIIYYIEEADKSSEDSSQKEANKSSEDSPQ